MSVPPPIPAERLPLSVTRVVATSLLVQFTFSTLAMSPAVFAPVAAAQMGVGAQWVGALYAVQAMSAMVLGTATTAVFQRFGIIRTLQAGSLAVGLAMLLGASGIPLLTITMGILTGLALGPAGPASTYLLTRVAPPEKLNLLASIQQTGPPIGIALGGVLFPPLILALGWQPALMLLSVAGVLLALYLHPLRALVDRRPAGGTGGTFGAQAFLQPIRLALAVPRLRELALAAPLFGFVHSGQVVFLVVYLNIELGRSLVLAGLALTASQVAAVIGRVFWGWLADRHRDPFWVLSLVAYGSALGTLALILYPRDGPGWPLVAISFWYGGTAAGWQGVLYATAARSAPDGRVVSAISGVQFFMFLGGISGPLVVAAIISLAGNYWSAYALLTVLAAGLGTRLLLARRRLTRR
jgi:MFS family permease